MSGLKPVLNAFGDFLEIFSKRYGATNSKSRRLFDKTSLGAALSFHVADFSVATPQEKISFASQSCGKITERLAPKGGLLFLHYLDVWPPDGSGNLSARSASSR